MSGTPPSKPPLPPGTIEFELTDFSDARDALDDLPEGVREVQALAKGGWEAQRRKPLASDRALTGKALEWLIGLPAELRPRQLSESYPRVANLIAEYWGHPQRRIEVLDELLTDSRGKRQGFPAAEAQELRNLRKHVG
jgi:hypothetical protein